jgi:hypothetical protein
MMRRTEHHDGLAETGAVKKVTITGTGTLSEVNPDNPPEDLPRPPWSPVGPA